MSKIKQEEMMSREQYKKVKKMNREQMSEFMVDANQIYLRNVGAQYTQFISETLVSRMQEVLKENFNFTDEQAEEFKDLFYGEDEEGNKVETEESAE